MDIKGMFQYTIALLNELSVRHDIHSFPSGAIMMDIWHEDMFYVIQFELDLIGISEINNENPGFDTIPDEKFYYNEDYKARLKELLT